MLVCRSCFKEKDDEEFRAAPGFGRREGYRIPHCKPCEYKRSKGYGARAKYAASGKPNAAHFNRKVRLAGRKPGAACEVCAAPYTETPCYDHNHDTAEFRGWLCRRCNMALGLAGDNPVLLGKLSVYLLQRGYAKTRG